LVYANGGGLVRVDCSNGGSYGSWFMPTAVRVDCSNGGFAPVFCHFSIYGIKKTKQVFCSVP